MKVSGLFPLPFLLPWLPRGAEEPAIVQEEPGAQGTYHGALGTSCGSVINDQLPLASRSYIGSPGRDSTPSCLSGVAGMEERLWRGLGGCAQE